MKYFTNHLGAKLFVSYIVVILTGVVILFFAARLSIPAIYNRHMMGIAGPGGGMGAGQRNGMMSDQLITFRDVFNEALAYAGAAAVVSALAVSIYLSRRIVAPLIQMTSASQRISKGHYDERVRVEGRDELGLLGESFNLMTSELEQTETRRKQLIGDISHELRTPLTAIKGSMEGLVDGVLDPTPDLFLQIQNETDRLSRLVDDLQELSRVESGAINLQIHPVSMNEILSTVVKRLGSAAYRNRIRIDKSAENLPPVLADEDRIVQVLTNLLVNAINYSSDQSEITVSGHVRDKFVVMAVQDQGIGMAPEHLAHVFDRFYRVDKSRARSNGGGSGIGLTISKSLVEAQGGRIWAESEGVGKGSIFYFTLPLAT